MTIRSRPVLDRKHRPRWQDELRTQQLTIIGFAIAIALAIGIFGATVWNNYWSTHFRPVAAVAGETLSASDLDVRARIITAEAIAQAAELQAQMGGPRDQLLQQQLDSLSQELNSLDSNAAASLVDGAVLAVQAGEYDVSVTDEDVDAELSERMTLPERIVAQLILIEALPDDAEADDEPTEEQLAAAREAAQAALDRVEDGADFAAVATDVSDDFTASTGGVLGWFQEDDTAYGQYWDALADAAVGDIVGPVETDRGFAVLELLGRRERTTEGGLGEALERQGIDDATYRSYLREELLTESFSTHFADEVAVSPAAQQRVAQIFIANVEGDPIPQERARHVLVQPDPELEDQAEASDEQWDAALEEAEEVRELLSEPDPDWFEVAEEHSDDTGSGARGGDLGWYDPESSPYVEEFADALAELEIGELSEPVRTDFGYHIIEKTAERESPQAQAAELVEQLREDPASFAEVATTISEDSATAREGGEIGWVARWQLDRTAEDAIFDLTEVDEISDPIEDLTTGITIYQLLETSESREIEDDRLEEIQSTGFTRWLDEEVRAPVETWLDPQYVTSTATS
jgi:parvulin-like peptidyl-prolyl isomerase